MNTDKRDRDDVYAATEGSDRVVAQQDAGQIQLSFFDEAVATPKMNTPTSDAISHKPEMELAPAAPIDAIQPDTKDVPAEPSPAVEAKQAFVAGDECLGQRLRTAREARGLSCEDAAHRLKLPSTVVQALEAERYERIGHGIYLRGYLTKYLQLLELPQVLADRVVSERVDQPPLVTSGMVSRPRYLFDRYSVSALYLILTGVIIVPAVLLAMRTGFDQNLARIAPLDAPEIAAPAGASLNESKSVSATLTIPAISAVSTARQSAPATSDEAPLIASMTPFPSAKSIAENVDDGDKPATESSLPVAGAHTLRLHLTEASWVEVVASDGKKLEYGLLPAGTVRSYASDKSLEVRLGNCNEASVEIDGKDLDLAPYRHANVAHFRLASGAAALSRSGG